MTNQIPATEPTPTKEYSAKSPSARLGIAQATIMIAQIELETTLEYYSDEMSDGTAKRLRGTRDYLANYLNKA